MKKIVLKENYLDSNKIVKYGFLGQYLMNLGIKHNDLESFIDKPRPTDCADPSGLINIDKAAQIFMDECGKGDAAKVFVQVDSDCDGFTSGAIVLQYIKRRFPEVKIEWRLHNGKEHGIILDTVPSDATLVIIPDAGSNQFNEHNALIESGKKVIVLDHHEIDDNDWQNKTLACIVNNQVSPNYPNKSLSGAGVAYKFAKYIDEHYFSDEICIADSLMDLAAIGIIADAMNMTTLDNNWIAYYGLGTIRNKFIRHLAVKQARGIKNPDSLTKMDVMWYIAPVINGVIRSGETEDKEMVFKALIEPQGEADMYEHVWRGVTKYENIYERAVRLAANAKSRQDSNKKKAFEWLCDDVRAKGLDKNNIIIETLDEKNSSKVGANITGLIAMELVKEFNKPCLVLRKTELEGKSVFGGSGRNGRFYNLPNLKDTLDAAGAEYTAGHQGAMGVFLTPEQVEPVTKYFNDNFDAAAFLDEVFEVDYWFHTGEGLNDTMLMQFAKAEKLYGNSIPAPKFAFDINIAQNQYFTMGAKQDSLKVRGDNGVDFVAFSCGDIIDSIKEEFKKSETIHLQIVGHPSLNEFNGKISVQVMIDDIEVKAVGGEATPEAAQKKVDWSDLI